MAQQTPSGSGPLSDRQQQVLDFLTSTVNDRGYPPSVREICDAVGLSSPSTVHSHLSSLVKAGYIRRDPSKPRAIEILTDADTAAPGRAPHTDDRLRDVPLVGNSSDRTPCSCSRSAATR
jgi:repressor LexA